MNIAKKFLLLIFALTLLHPFTVMAQSQAEMFKKMGDAVKTYHLNKGRIHVEVGAPITAEELAALREPRQQASAMRKEYQRRYQDLCNRLEQL